MKLEPNCWLLFSILYSHSVPKQNLCLNTAINRSNATILVRPHSFQARDVQYLIQLSSSNGSSNEPAGGTQETVAVHTTGQAATNSLQQQQQQQQQQQLQCQLTCWRVPTHLQLVPWMDLSTTRKAELTECLVVPSAGSLLCKSAQGHGPVFERAIPFSCQLCMCLCVCVCYCVFSVFLVAAFSFTHVPTPYLRTSKPALCTRSI